MELLAIGVDLPVGDAGGMRTKAARLGLDCAALLARATAVDARCAQMVYRCAAGDDFRRRVATRRGQLENLVQELRAVQRDLLREAARLEAAQAAWGQLSRLIESGAAGTGRDLDGLAREVRSLVREL
jgi:hypothetical protein